MALVRWEPRAPMSVADRMSRLFEDVLGGWEETPMEAGAFRPRVNVYEKGDNLIVEAELPGMKKEDIDVRVENNTLTLRGERKKEEEINEENFYRMERRYGAFSRSFTLPATVDVGKIDAKFENGILKVVLPKLEEARPKQIAIH